MSAPELSPDELARHNAFFIAAELNTIAAELEVNK